jgi:nucleoid-associated protein EbfC
MFGLDKLKDFKKNAQEVKDRLEGIIVEGHAGNNMVTVKCTGARQISEITIDDRVHRTAEKEQLEKLLIEACNNALANADTIAQSEMQGIMPNIPGLGI